MQLNTQTASSTEPRLSKKPQADAMHAREHLAYSLHIMPRTYPRTPMLNNTHICRLHKVKPLLNHLPQAEALPPLHRPIPPHTHDLIALNPPRAHGLRPRTRPQPRRRQRRHPHAVAIRPLLRRLLPHLHPGTTASLPIPPPTLHSPAIHPLPPHPSHQPLEPLPLPPPPLLRRTARAQALHDPHAAVVRRGRAGPREGDGELLWQAVGLRVVVAQGGGEAGAALGRDEEGGELWDGDEVRAEGEVGVCGVEAHGCVVGWGGGVVVGGGGGGGEADLARARRLQDGGVLLLLGGLSVCWGAEMIALGSMVGASEMEGDLCGPDRWRCGG